jgi:hypothetical protein
MLCTDRFTALSITQDGALCETRMLCTDRFTALSVTKACSRVPHTRSGCCVRIVLQRYP